MANTLWNFFELAVTVFEEFVIIHFICGFLGHNFSTIKGKVIYVAGSLVGSVIVTVANNLLVFESWLGIIYMAYWLIFALLFLEGKFLYKVFSVVLADFIVFFSNSLISSSISAIFNSNDNIAYSQISFIRFLTIIMVQMCLVYFFSLILKLVDKELLKLKKSEWILIISVFAISILSLTLIQLSLLKINANTNVDVYDTALLLGSEICIVTLNSICLYMTVALSKRNRSAEELKLKTQQYEHNIQYAETIRKQYEEMKSIRHDIKQHLTVIQRLQRDGNITEAVSYTDSCVQIITAPEVFIDVGDVFINSILNSKLSIAKSKGIKVLCRVEQNISGISAFDLCNLLGNILDNAIAGAQSAENAKYIEVVIKGDDFKLNICVSNSISQSVIKTNKELKTSKNNRGQHGLGIKTIRSIAEKYNGTVDFYEEGLIFFCHVILYK